MRFQVKVAGEPRVVELRRDSSGWQCAIEGQAHAADVVAVAPGVFSLLLAGRSFTVRVERVGEKYRVHTREGDFGVEVANPRQWRGRSGGEPGATGRREINAPMPGKVIRVLVGENQAVEAGQGLVVVEAMKMQNEIPSPKAGTVEKVLVRAGDTVEHGAVLLVVV